jgi:hypothetical protein
MSALVCNLQKQLQLKHLMSLRGQQLPLDALTHHHGFMSNKQNIAGDIINSDPKDKNFGDTEVGSESDNSEGNCIEIPNEEVCS